MHKDYEKPILLENLSKLSLVSIGPFTSEELKKFDVSYTVSKIHTVAGSFDTMKNKLIQ
jgi:uroporphyrinogen-III synthase